MFIGHFALGFAAKSVEPRVSLSVLPDGLAESTSPLGPILAVMRTEPFMFGSSWRPLL